MLLKKLGGLLHFSTSKEEKQIYLLTYQYVEDMYYKRRFYNF